MFITSRSLFGKYARNTGSPFVPMLLLEALDASSCMNREECKISDLKRSCSCLLDLEYYAYKC
jgi:hypothetical protein